MKLNLTHPGFELVSSYLFPTTVTVTSPCVYVCMSEYMCVRVYIYIYIYNNPQTECFVVSQHFSVARYVRCHRLGSKPGWLYACRISYRRAIAMITVCKGIFLNMYIYTLTASGVINSWKELYICVYIYIYIYICLKNYFLLVQREKKVDILKWIGWHRDLDF